MQRSCRWGCRSLDAGLGPEVVRVGPEVLLGPDEGLLDHDDVLAGSKEVLRRFTRS